MAPTKSATTTDTGGATNNTTTITSLPRTTPTPTTTGKEQLTFEKKNTNLLHIPHNYRIQKRPIPRAPIASPYAGSEFAKLVYISTKTPFMSAVKRVQKLLRLAERRAMMPVIEGRQARKQQQKQYKQQYGQKGRGNGNGEQSVGGEKTVLDKCQQRLRLDKVLVKATGRAIEKALAVGKWFEMGKGGDAEYEVVVKTGSVCVVDDIVEEDSHHDEDGDDDDDDDDEDHDDDGDADIVMNNDSSSDHDMNETNNTDNLDEVENQNPEKKEENDTKQSNKNATTESKNQRRRRRKRERTQQQRLKAFKDEDGEPPESRTRWVNMVEIAINMK